MIREVLIAAAMTVAAAVPLHPAAAAGPTLTVVPATVRQGDAAEIIVTGVIDSTARLRFAGRTWPLYRSGAAWRTFVGTDPLTTPGLRTVTLEIRGPSGIIRLVSASIRVRRVSFPTRRITLDPDRRPLLDPRLAQEEGRTVAAALHRLIPDRLWEGSFRLPVQGVVSSPYGVVSVYQGQPRGFHHGIDLAAPAGTPVYAANNGIVRLAEKLPLSGNAVLMTTAWALLHPICINRCWWCGPATGSGVVNSSAGWEILDCPPDRTSTGGCG